MNSVKRFVKYMWYIAKDIFMIVCIGLDIVGVIVECQINVEIPQWIYIIILVVGFIGANYKLYIDNAPEITLNTSLLNKYSYKVRSAGNSYVNLMVNYNLYIQNSSSNAGIVEKIDVDLLGFSKCKDKFLVDKVGVKYNEFFVADEEVFTPLEFMKHKVETKFPIILGPKELIKKILILYIDIDCTDEEDYRNTLKWMQDIEFMVTVDVKNNNVEKQNKYKIKVAKVDIENARIHEMKSNEELQKFFDRMES